MTLLPSAKSTYGSNHQSKELLRIMLLEGRIGAISKPDR